MIGRLAAAVPFGVAGCLLVSLVWPVQAATPGSDAKAILDQARQPARAQPATQKATPAADAIARRDQLTRRFDWTLFAMAFVLPMLAGLLTATVFWCFSDDTAIGAAVGAAFVLMAAIALFAHEFAELSRMHAACVAAGRYCPVFPGDLNRYMIIGFMAFVDIAALYLLSLRVGEWRRRRATATL